MWDVPFFQSANILAVGITPMESTVHNRKWYAELENSSYSPDLNFKRGIFFLCYPYVDMVHIPYCYNYLLKASAT
jgi:hypothetical protein